MKVEVFYSDGSDLKRRELDLTESDLAIEFTLDNGQRFAVSLRDTGSLDVHATRGQLLIEPRASNAVYLQERR